MKISKRQLRRIIKEEKARLLREQSPEAHTDIILANFSDAMDRIEALKGKAHGLVEPFSGSRSDPAPRMDAGDKLAEELQMELEDLDVVYRQLNAYFKHGVPK